MWWGVRITCEATLDTDLEEWSGSTSHVEDPNARRCSHTYFCYRMPTGMGTWREVLDVL